MGGTGHIGAIQKEQLIAEFCDNHSSCLGVVATETTTASQNKRWSLNPKMKIDPDRWEASLSKQYGVKETSIPVNSKWRDHCMTPDIDMMTTEPISYLNLTHDQCAKMITKSSVQDVPYYAVLSVPYDERNVLNLCYHITHGHKKMLDKKAERMGGRSYVRAGIPQYGYGMRTPQISPSNMYVNEIIPQGTAETPPVPTLFAVCTMTAGYYMSKSNDGIHDWHTRLLQRMNEPVDGFPLSQKASAWMTEMFLTRALAVYMDIGKNSVVLPDEFDEFFQGSGMSANQVFTAFTLAHQKTKNDLNDPSLVQLIELFQDVLDPSKQDGIANLVKSIFMGLKAHGADWANDDRKRRGSSVGKSGNVDEMEWGVQSLADYERFCRGRQLTNKQMIFHRNGGKPQTLVRSCASSQILEIGPSIAPQKKYANSRRNWQMRQRPVSPMDPKPSVHPKPEELFNPGPPFPQHLMTL
jgi:hypothetical protein